MLPKLVRNFEPNNRRSDLHAHSILGSAPTDASATTHSSACAGELERRSCTHDFIVIRLANCC
jgi:hypothetical protein